MTTQSTKKLTAAVFLSAVLLHILIISAAFIRFNVSKATPVQTQFVMHSIPKPAAPPAAPAPKQTQPKREPAEKKVIPVPQPIVQEKAVEPDEAVPESQSETAEEASETAVPLAGDIGRSASAAVDFKSLIVQRIAEKKIYPKAARKRNQEGTVTLRIVVLKSGALAQADIITPCNYTFLNEAAVASVRAAAPFPLGADAPDRIELTVTLEYRLEG